MYSTQGSNNSIRLDPPVWIRQSGSETEDPMDLHRWKEGKALRQARCGGGMWQRYVRLGFTCAHNIAQLARKMDWGIVK